MAVSINATESQGVSTLDALWTLIRTQKKSVQRALAKRLNAAIEAEKEPKVKMTEEEFYAKIDRSLVNTSSGPVYTMGENESGEEFINRILSQHR